MKEYNFYVYILTNWNNEVMYIGMTNNLERRLYEHKHKLVRGFTAKYNINKLLFFSLRHFLISFSRASAALTSVPCS